LRSKASNFWLCRPAKLDDSKTFGCQKKLAIQKALLFIKKENRRILKSLFFQKNLSIVSFGNNVKFF
jgi:hypothetical protein